MPEKSVPQSDPSSPHNGNPPPAGILLSSQEWQEISDCTTALFAALKCFEEHRDEAWDLVVSVQQRLQRAIAPVGERLSNALHSNGE